MRAFVKPTEAQREILEFLLDREEATPEDVREALKDMVRPGLLNSAVAVVNAMELIYARHVDLPAGLVEIGIAVAVLVADRNYHGLGANGRAAAISTVLSRHIGRLPEIDRPDVEPPKPLDRYLPPAGSPVEPPVDPAAPEAE